MINNLRISLAELIIWALFATAGLVWTAARVLDGLERVWDWWRDRRELLDENHGLCAGCAGVAHCDGREPSCDCTCTWPEDWADEEALPPLPPERSWEQITSHQLPLTGSNRNADDLADGGGLWHGPDAPDPPTGPLSVNRERVVPLLGSRQATAHYRRLERARKRRFTIVSAEIWRAYAAVGLEGTGFTRAMARQVRELTP